MKVLIVDDEKPARDRLRQLIDDFGNHEVVGDAANGEEAIAMAEEIGYPIVMKIASPDILHKTEVGGVKTAIYYPEDVQEE